MLDLPAPTPFDLNFQLLRIPVRVNPLFWIMAAFLGWNAGDVTGFIIWIGIVFLSILIHEFGHGLTARKLTGQQPTIVLHAMGGLCAYDRAERSAGQRILVLLMGPGAGFILFAITALFSAIVIGSIDFNLLFYPVRIWFHAPPNWMNVATLEAVDDLLYINLAWGLFNLLPIYPLDGGQISHALFSKYSRRGGVRQCFILSLVMIGLLAIYFYSQRELYTVFFLAYLGLMNFRMLTAGAND